MDEIKSEDATLSSDEYVELGKESYLSVTHICPPACNWLFRPLRKAVSGGKRRYETDGFDLDLVYMSSRIIVHGFPAVGLEHMYRNPRGEIRRFMDKRHPGKYKIYNFCAERGRQYDANVFDGRVGNYPFTDHSVPTLGSVIAFAEDAKAYLDSDPGNAVGLHCKAGKGRAGLMCCILLIRTGAVQSARQALELYDAKRVTNQKGLTVTSQRKFVVFYEMIWRQIWKVQGNIGMEPAAADELSKCRVLPREPRVCVKGIELLNAQTPSKSRFVTFLISNLDGENDQSVHLESQQSAFGGAFSTDCNSTVHGNFSVKVMTPGLTKSGRVLELVHNTLFMNKLGNYVDFTSSQVDIKKKMLHALGDDFVLRLHYMV